MPRPGQVLGLVGTNGIGKSTALKILAGKLKPNLGRFASPPDWEEILGYFRGSELQVSVSVSRKQSLHAGQSATGGCRQDQSFWFNWQFKEPAAGLLLCSSATTGSGTAIKC